ncbi:MAG: 50S ribosomal protein L24 [Bacteroidota bacterium]
MNIKNSHKLHIKKGETVKVIAGNYKNQTGEVLQVFPQRSRAIVKGINMVTIHLKPTQQKPKGGRIRKEAPIHISNLMLVDPTTQNAIRNRIPENSQEYLDRYPKKVTN